MDVRRLTASFATPGIHGIVRKIKLVDKETVNIANLEKDNDHPCGVGWWCRENKTYRKHCVFC